MLDKELCDLLKRYKDGELSDEEMIDSINSDRTEPLGFAHIDHHRKHRKGFPEVIFCQGKTPVQVAVIAERIVQNSGKLLATRADNDDFKAVKKVVPGAEFLSEAGVIYFSEKEIVPENDKLILIVSAGTSDIPVAEEAKITAKMLGCKVESVYDIGVAGIHRVFKHIDLLKSASAVIVTAGMEGALASVVAGLIDKPVIAVPTSVGYGVSFGGVTALLAMLNSCASGVTVVNIDNGFGAGFAASLIVKT